MKITERLLPLLMRQESTRNIAIVAHIDHGKTTFSDSLLASSGLLSKDLAGKALYLDSRDDERERGITIDSALASIIYERTPDPRESDRFLINLVDTPGHIDFGGDVTRAMRAVDGCIVLVCAVEGVMPQTETVLRQALKERVKPVLFINKIDRLIKELQLTPEAMQERLLRIITDVNSLIRHETDSTHWDVSVQDDSVCFGSAFHGWAISASIMKERKISFNDIIAAYQDTSDEPRYRALAKSYPLHAAVLSAVVRHIPDPVQAQALRIPAIWHGDQASAFGQGLMRCDKDAELSFVITKIEVDVHAGDICVGRIFSGTARPGKSLVLCRTGAPVSILHLFAQEGPKRDRVPEACAGCLIAISGIKGARAGDTLTERTISPFEPISSSFDAVLTKSIEPERPQDMAVLVKALEQAAQEDPSLAFSTNKDTGEMLISGMGELHLEVVEQRITRETGIALVTGAPLVIYKESVTRASSRIATPPKADREGSHALALPDSVQDGPGRNIVFVFRAEPLRASGKQHELVIQAAPPDVKRSDALLEQVKTAFVEAMAAGPLAREPCVGMRIVCERIDASGSSLHDVSDIATLAPMIRNAIRDAIKRAGPVLLEPVDTLRFELPGEYIGEISKLIAAKRGDVVDMKQGDTRVTLHAKLAVAQMIGLASDMRTVTEGRASFSIVSQDFEPVPSDLQERTIEAVRRRKGLQFSAL